MWYYRSMTNTQAGRGTMAADDDDAFPYGIDAHLEDAYELRNGGDRFDPSDYWNYPFHEEGCDGPEDDPELEDDFDHLENDEWKADIE
jgi:hypothetical protein